MCGKCVILEYDEVLDVIHELELGVPVGLGADWPARPTRGGDLVARPGSVIPVIVAQPVAATPGVGRGSQLAGPIAPATFTWGFREPWGTGLVFNTRIESAGKPLWRDSMEHRRCIIPVCSFFETSATETVPSPRTGRPVKRAYEFTVPGSPVSLIGGVWKDGRLSMVTTEANRWMVPVHHRMPLVIHQEELPVWLGPDYRQLADRSSVELAVAPEQPTASSTHGRASAPAVRGLAYGVEADDDSARGTMTPLF